MMHPCGLSRLRPVKKQRANTEKRPSPKLPRIPEEMRQWSDLHLHEVLGWPDVSSRPMFGMTAVYRGNTIFGVLPRTRALPSTHDAKWISFELQSGDDLPDAIGWFEQAYRLAAKGERG
jgi:hypothetical protein